MRLKIFSCYHFVPEQEITTDLFQSLVTGVTPPPDSATMSDLSGKNISHLDKFSELRQQYFVWQNHLHDLDYVGFEHYRRLFYIDPLPYEKVRDNYPLVADAREYFAKNKLSAEVEMKSEGFKQYLDMRRSFGDHENSLIRKWVSSYDIIYAIPIPEPVDENFKRYHEDASHLWDDLGNEVKKIWPYMFRNNYVSTPTPWSAYLNMYILRADLFSEYMEMVMPLLLEMNRKFPDAPSRIWGHCAERMLGAYLIQKCAEDPTLRVANVPILFFRNEYYR